MSKKSDISEQLFHLIEQWPQEERAVLSFMHEYIARHGSDDCMVEFFRLFTSLNNGINATPLTVLNGLYDQFNRLHQRLSAMDRQSRYFHEEMRNHHSAMVDVLLSDEFMRQFIRNLERVHNAQIASRAALPEYKVVSPARPSPYSASRILRTGFVLLLSFSMIGLLVHRIVSIELAESKRGLDSPGIAEKPRNMKPHLKVPKEVQTRFNEVGVRLGFTNTQYKVGVVFYPSTDKRQLDLRQQNTADGGIEVFIYEPFK